MTYEYQDSDSKTVVEKEFDMGQAPSEIDQDGKKFKRIFGNLSINIPEHMQSKSKINRKFNFDKPITGKHFW